MKILITNIASVTAISIIKILRRGKIKNILIWGTESQKYGYNSGSMLVDHYIEVPKVSSEHYTECILYICQHYYIDALFPILDEELLLFSKSNLHKYVKLLLPNTDTICLFRNKLLASKELQNLCKTIIPQIFTEYDSVNCNKVIIRQKQSIGSQGITIKNKNDLSTTDFDNSKNFIQEYIEGSEYTVDILADKLGKIKLIVPRERIQIKNGVSTKVLVSENKEIIDLCMKIYEKYYIPGLSNVQFIEKNKSIYFLELNMRFAGMGIASILASYDFLSDYILYLTDNGDLGEYATNMKKIRWNSVVCRYYEETILMQ